MIFKKGQRLFYAMVGLCFPVGLLYGLITTRVPAWKALVWSLAYGGVGYAAFTSQSAASLGRLLEKFWLLQVLFVLPLLAGAMKHRQAATGYRIPPLQPRSPIGILAIGYVILMQCGIALGLMDFAPVVGWVAFAVGHAPFPSLVGAPTTLLMWGSLATHLVLSLHASAGYTKLPY